jgi:hypothetical protein
MVKMQTERVAWSRTSAHMYMLRAIKWACAANQSTLREFAERLAETRGLQAGSITVDITTIAAWLGHAQLFTTRGPSRSACG